MLDKTLAQSCKVLVVDDPVLAHGYLKFPLEDLGFQDVAYVGKVSQAKEAIHARSYDLIFCSYDIKKDTDGYFFYDEMVANNEISPATAFIFISADTSLELIHSIVELQPDDFLAKPFTIGDLSKRLHKVLTRKRALRKIYRYIEIGNYDKALDTVNEFLTDSSKIQFFPQALKVKGEILYDQEKYREAKEFYIAVLNVQEFAWAQSGLIKALIKLDEDDQAEKMILRLAFKPESQLMAYDMLADLQIKQKDYDTALESSVVAAEVSPRNIRRHKKTVDLSRITNDYKTQFEASKKIVKAAKDSIHDQPEIYLDVARAGIDSAMTTEEDETKVLAQQAESYLKQFEETADKRDVQEQLDVAQARLFQLHDEKDKAKKLLTTLQNDDWSALSTTDLMDRAKAYHEVGLHDQSQRIMEEIERRVRKDSSESELFSEYVSKEKQQRIDIKQTPKELNNSAVRFYQRGDTDSAFKAFHQAFTIMPKNPSIALNLLQTMSRRALESGLEDSAKTVIARCTKIIDSADLDAEQKERYDKVRAQLSEM
ncbi:MAG: response regulator [Alteromonadaceae bacterium]|nr:response regulator [Alteromonadaceae bacterium]